MNMFLVLQDKPVVLGQFLPLLNDPGVNIYMMFQVRQEVTQEDRRRTGWMSSCSLWMESYRRDTVDAVLEAK